MQIIRGIQIIYGKEVRRVAGIVGQKEIGIRIAMKRQEMGMTQEQFAEKLEISRKTLVHIEHGEAAPSLATLNLFFRESGMTPNELFYEKKEEPVLERITRMMEKMDQEDQQKFWDVMETFARGILTAI